MRNPNRHSKIRNVATHRKQMSEISLIANKSIVFGQIVSNRPKPYSFNIAVGSGFGGFCVPMNYIVKPGRRPAKAVPYKSHGLRPGESDRDAARVIAGAQPIAVNSRVLWGAAE
jgi:hypothetical protein